VPQFEKRRPTLSVKARPYAGFVASAIASPLAISEPGRILAIVTIDDEEIVCAGLNVHKDQAAD
jgi:hypothetical protein